MLQLRLPTKQRRSYRREAAKGSVVDLLELKRFRLNHSWEPRLPFYVLCVVEINLDVAMGDTYPDPDTCPVGYRS